MKRILCVIVLITTLSTAKADVIYSPYMLNMLSYSIEGVYSLEFALNYNSSISWWSGVGFLGSIIVPRVVPFYGIETAIEVRRYFKPDTYEGYNLGLYFGTALMRFPKVRQDSYYLGFVPGIKLTRKSYIKSKILLEPYVSLSAPITYMYPQHFDFPVFPVLTVGVRIGFNSLVRSKQS